MVKLQNTKDKKVILHQLERKTADIQLDWEKQEAEDNWDVNF